MHNNPVHLRDDYDHCCELCVLEERMWSVKDDAVGKFDSPEVES
jgi:hypothetical protein